MLDVVAASALLLQSLLGPGKAAARLLVLAVDRQALGEVLLGLLEVAHLVGGARHAEERLLVVRLELDGRASAHQRQVVLVERQIGGRQVAVRFGALLLAQGEQVPADRFVVALRDEVGIAATIELVEGELGHARVAPLVDAVRVRDDLDVGRRLDADVKVGAVEHELERRLLHNDHRVERYERGRIDVVRRRVVVDGEVVDGALLVLGKQHHAGHEDRLDYRAADEIAARVRLIHEHVAEEDGLELVELLQAALLGRHRVAQLHFVLAAIRRLLDALGHHLKAHHSQESVLVRPLVRLQRARVLLRLERLVQNLCQFRALHFASRYILKTNLL